MVVLLPFGGLIIGYVASTYLATSRRVMFVRERDRRGVQYSIKKEDHIKVITKGNPPLRIYKYRGAYEFVAGMGRKVTTFFAKEGTAYNMALESGDVEVKQDLSKGENFGEIAKIIWGEEFYKSVPEDRRRMLETKAITMTVNIESGITPIGYAPITEQNISADGNENMAAAVAKGVTKGMGIPWINYIFSIGCGTGITFAICLLMGWIKLA
jgi:hypothetical protein